MKLVVNKKNIEEFTQQVTVTSALFKNAEEGASRAAAQAIERIILDGIRHGYDKDAMGAFMADRTKITATINGGKAVIAIRGMTEGEANADESRTGGDVDPATNLWIRHEYSATYDPASGKITYAKDAAGITVQREGTAGSVGSKHKGKIDKIIKSLRLQMIEAATVMLAIATDAAATGAITTASKGKIKIDRRASAAFKRAGVDKSTLARMGVSNVVVRDSGQILLVGKGYAGAGVFVGGKSVGIPTSINR